MEARVLGCLLEKERLTPENYPLSLHSLTAACNQSTSRASSYFRWHQAATDAFAAADRCPRSVRIVRL